MASETLPEIIDIAAASLLDLSKPVCEQNITPTQAIIERPPIILRKPETSDAPDIAGEYNEEINILIMKSTIMTQLSLIEDIEELSDGLVMRQMYNVVKNLLIINGPVLHRHPHFVEEMERCVAEFDRCYDSYTLKNMLRNIKKGVYRANMTFREITDTVSNLPPISAEKRKEIEETLPQFRQPKQMKKAPEVFIVDEIVGAKDKENKWWLARILHRYQTAQSPDIWYYIRFENCGPMHDEWICSRTYRVKRYNPRKHFLKRRAR
jgi:hypothetical protein